MREYFEDHFKTIRSCFFKDVQLVRQRLIIYRQILQQGEVTADDSPAQAELLRAGVLVKQQGKLRIYNRLYQEVFNQTWVENQLVPSTISNEISAWTDDNQFLAERLRKLVLACEDPIPVNGEADLVRKLVRSRVIDGWENGHESQHIHWREIRDRLLNQEHSTAILKLYQRILQNLEVTANDSPEQVELLDLGLLVNQNGILRVSKRIYQYVFDLSWVERELLTLGPKETEPHVVNNNISTPNTTPKVRSVKNFLISTLNQIKVKLRTWIRNAQLSQYVYYVFPFLLGLILSLFVANGFYQLYQSDIQRIEQEGDEALKEFDSKELIGLQKAVKSGEDLKKQVSNNNIPLSDYPTFTPLLALQKILDNIYERNELNEHDAPVRSVSFSPNGKLIATAGEDGSVRLWNLSDKPKLISPETVKQGIVMSVSFSPNGKLIATGGENGTVRFWNRSHKPIGLPLQAYDQGRVTSISFSPRGELIATVGSNKGSVKLWNIKSRQQIDPDPHLKVRGDGNFESVSFSPDGESLATAEEGGIVRLWKWNEPDEDKPVNPLLEGQQGGIQSVSFSPDGTTIATAGKNGKVGLWNLQGKAKSRPLETGEPGGVLKVSFIKNGKLIATAGESGIVQLWQLTTASDDSTVNRWSLSANRVAELNGHERRVYSVEFSPDEDYLVTGGIDHTVRLWKLSNLQKAPFHFENQENIESMNIGKVSDGEKHLALLRKDGTVKILKIPSKDEISLNANLKSISNISLSPDKQHLATLEKGGTLRLWNLSGEQLGNELETRSQVIDVILGSNEVCVTREQDGKASIWKFSGSEVKLKDFESKIRSVSFSPDGQLIATGGEDSIVKIWKQSGEKSNEQNTHSNGVLSVKFSPDGQRIVAVGNDQTVQLWKLSNKRITHRVTQWKVDGITKVDFSPDGKLVATAGNNKNISIWDLRGRQLAEFDSGWGKTVSVSFTHDGKQIAAAGDNSTVQIWPIENLDSLIERGCNWLQDYFKTNSEKREELKICS